MLFDETKEKDRYSDANVNDNPKRKVAGFELSNSEVHGIFVGLAALVGIVVGRLSKQNST